MAASVRNAAVGASAFVSALVIDAVTLVTAESSSVRASAVATDQDHPIAKVASSIPSAMSNIFSVRGDTPARCQRLFAGAGR